MTEKALTNKVAQKAIESIDLESFIPKATDIVAFDVKDFLFKGLLLREKDFRAQLKSFDFSKFQQKYVYIYCSTDAIVPMWAYMLLSTYLSKVVAFQTFAPNLPAAEEQFVLHKIKTLDTEKYQKKRIVVKGCGNKKFSPAVYIAISQKLQTICKALSFGEACSMVPVYKKTNNE